MNQAYIALGSNLEDPLAQLQHALKTLRSSSQCELIKVSSAYQNRAIGPGAQGDYINAVALLNTPLKALQLLDFLQGIENNQGRTRELKWGARTLDLDILLFNDELIEHERLSIPHPRMFERDFVIIPLNEISPELIILGKSCQSLSQSFDPQALQRIVLQQDD